MAHKNPNERREYDRRWKQAYRAANKKKHRDYMREYYHRPEVNAKRRAYDKLRHTEARKRAIRNCRLKKLYGITVDQYDALLQSQGGVCAICQRPPRGKGVSNRFLHVDHNHSTGAIRGLLCSSCNHAVGQLEDNPDYAINLSNYLAKYSLRSAA